MPVPLPPSVHHSPPRTVPPFRCAHYMTRMRLWAGGPVRAVLDLCGTLAARGHDVLLLTSDPADVPPHWLDGAPATPKVITLDSPGRFTKLLPRRALDRARQVLEGSQVLHLHGAWEVTNLQFAHCPTNQAPLRRHRPRHARRLVDGTTPAQEKHLPVPRRKKILRARRRSPMHRPRGARAGDEAPRLRPRRRAPLPRRPVAVRNAARPRPRPRRVSRQPDRPAQGAVP